MLVLGGRGPPVAYHPHPHSTTHRKTKDKGNLGRSQDPCQAGEGEERTSGFRVTLT